MENADATKMLWAMSHRAVSLEFSENILILATFDMTDGFDMAGCILGFQVHPVLYVDERRREGHYDIAVNLRIQTDNQRWLEL